MLCLVAGKRTRAVLWNVGVAVCVHSGSVVANVMKVWGFAWALEELPELFGREACLLEDGLQRALLDVLAGVHGYCD